MRDGVPIKVKIGLKPNGHADYPNWKALPLADLPGATEEAKEGFVRAHQIVKWRYDTVGHNESAPDSPIGMQWGMMVVSQQFADEATAMFPALVTEMTEEEAEVFWARCHANQPEERVKSEPLLALKAQRDLMIDLAQDTTAIDARVVAALDPNNPEPGVTLNLEKSWTDAKTSLEFDTTTKRKS